MKITEVTLAFDKDFDLTELDDMSEEDENDEHYKEIIRYEKRLKGLSSKLSPHFATYQIIDRENLLDIHDAPYDKGKEIFERLNRSREFIST